MVRSPRQKRNATAKSPLTYDRCEPRTMLTIIVDVGDLNSGVAVSDDATGEGYIMFSQTDVHDRFSGIGADNADHFVATRIDGLQWQYNNDSSWINFEPADGDALVAKVNFSGDSIVNPEGRIAQQGIWSQVAGVEDQNHILVVANQFGGQFDKDEFTVLGNKIEIEEFAPARVLPSEAQLEQIVSAIHFYGEKNDRLPGLANFDSDGNALLSWRVHLLPHMGLENLYAQFNLDEPWNSPHNLALADQMPDVYKSLNFDSPNRTTFAGVAGENAWFQLDGTPIDTRNLGNVDDAVVVEVNNSRSVVWTSPIDWYVSPENPLSGLGDASEEGFAVALLSGKTATIDADVDPAAFANLLDTTDRSILEYSALGIDNLDPIEAMNNHALAILNYESAHQRLPHQAIRADDGTPLLSWRVAILPFLGYGELYGQFNLDEAWDSANNLPLLSQMPLEFRHSSVGDNKTVYLGLDGDGTVFNSELTRGMTFAQMTDGTSNTILIVEADATEAVEWTRPVDLNYDSADSTRGLGALQPDGRFFGTLVDSSTESFATDQADKVAAWASAAGGEVNDYGILDEDLSSSWRNTTEIKLRNLMLASLNHESAHMEFPHTIYDTPSGDGSPLLSWRVRILPWIEHSNLYNQFHFDEPWDSDHNLSLLPLMPQIFRTPGVPNGMTVFQGPHGDNTFFSNTNDGTRWQQFQGADTASILQVAPDHAIEWTRPDDFSYDPATLRSFFESSDATGFHFALVDGSVHYFHDALSTELLNKIVSPADYNDVYLDTKVFRDAADNRMQHDLRQIALGIHNYESANMHFPHHATYTERRGGDPLFSWRVEILPFIGHQDLYNQFNLDEPWDSDHNLSLIPLMPHLYKHPSVENGMTVTQVVSSNWTSGEPLESMFPLTNAFDIGFGAITDGTSNTIMIVEANLDEAVAWTKPEDIVYDSADPSSGLTVGEDFQGTWAALGDGSVHFIHANLLDEPLANAINPSDGNISNIDLDSSYQYGTITPNLFAGTDGDDSVVINVTDDTLELIINGTSQSFPLSQFDPLVFDALGGVDDLTINGPAGADVTFSNGVIEVGGLAIVAEGFESLEFDGDVSLMIGGTVGDDQIVLRYDDDALTGTINASPLGLPTMLAEQKIVIDAGLGSDRLQILLNRVQSQTSVENNTLRSFSNYEIEWNSVEFVDIDNEQDIQSSFIFFMDPDSDSYSVTSDQIVVTGDTTITLERGPDDATGLGNRTNTPMPINVTGTSGDDAFDFGYTQDGFPLFKFEHLVYFPDSPVFFDGGDGNDTFSVNQFTPYIQPIMEAELSPNSASIDDYELISWTNVENQIATDIGQVEMIDSAGDDHLQTDGTNSNVQFSGDGFSWTLNDIGFMRTTSTTGFDTADMTGNGLFFNLDLLTINVNGARFANIGFENSTVTPTGSSDVGNFTFSNVAAVDLDVRDEEVVFTSAESGAAVSLTTLFAGVNLRGEGSNRATITDNAASGTSTNAHFDLIQFEDADLKTFNVMPEGMSEITIVAGVNNSPLAMHGPDDGVVATLDTDGTTMTSEGASIASQGYDDVYVFGTRDVEDTAVLEGDFVSVTPIVDGAVVASANSIVRLLLFTSINFNNPSSLPPIFGTDGDDEFVVDYTGTLKTLTVNGATPAFTADDDTDFNIDGRLGNDTLSIAVPNSGQTTLWRSRLGSSKGDTEFVSIENIDLSGTDNEVVSVEFAAGFRNVVSVGDQQYVLTSSDGSATVTGSAIDFTSFFTDDDNGTLAFIEARTSPGTVLAGFNEILFVGTESLSYPAVPIQIIGGSIGSVVEIFDSSGDDQLTIDDGQVTLTSALGGQISATEFSEFIVTATDGNDTGSFRVSEDTPYSEIQVQSDGLVFKSSTGDVRTRGLDTIYTFEDNLLPLIRGTSDDDTFTVSYLDADQDPAPLRITINDIETEFLTEGASAIRINGETGSDSVIINSRQGKPATLTSSYLQVEQLDVAVRWSEVEDIVVHGNVQDSLDFHGTEADETLGLGGTSAILFGPSIPSVTAVDFGEVDAFGGGGDDTAYLSGETGGSNTFIGAAAFGRMTTPAIVLTAYDFDLVAATAGGDNDLASFVGTMEDEQLFVSPETARMVGGSFIRNASGFNRVIAQSGGGSDYANVTDSVGDDLFYVRPGYSRTEFGTGQTATLTDFLTVRSVSTEGEDRAQLIGTQTNERFIASDRFGRFNSGGFSAIAVSYPSVLANGGGGEDEAYLSDSDGDDFFFGSPAQSFLNGDGFNNTAIDFDRVVAFGSEGQDSAELNGSESDDRFYANPTVADLSGDGYFRFVSGFDFVRAIGFGGNDSATLRDSSDVDRFFANANLSYLRNDNYHNEVRGFANVKAISTAGEDIATFEGSAGDELFHGHRDSSYIEGNGFRNQVNGFTAVSVTGLAGSDVANLYDSDEDENFGARENKAWLEGETYRLLVTDFESVNAFGFQGGTNSFFVDDPDFDWERFGNWDG